MARAAAGHPRARRTRAGVPLSVLTGVATLLGCFIALGTVAGVFAVTHRLHPDLAPGLLVGSVVGLLVAAVFAAGAAELGRELRNLRAEAVRRLHDPSAEATPGLVEHWPARFSLEIAELARTLDALHLRVRVADEVAQRHRRSAETASAGMYELLSGLVAAEEGARGQLSAELHDTAAQTLMLARSLLADPDPGPQDVERVANLVAEAEEQVRAVMARTRPPALRDGDLARAVGVLRDDLAARYGMAVHVEWPEQAYPLPLATAVTVYRFFQEALLNVVKHADVDEAWARLHVDDEEVVAVVRDDGPGFDPSAVTPERGRHVGLGLLRERARLAGGGLEVVSRPDQGTMLMLRLPRTAASAAVPAPRLPVPGNAPVGS